MARLLKQTIAVDGLIARHHYVSK